MVALPKPKRYVWGNKSHVTHMAILYTDDEVAAFVKELPCVRRISQSIIGSWEVYFDERYTDTRERFEQAHAWVVEQVENAFMLDMDVE